MKSVEISHTTESLLHSVISFAGRRPSIGYYFERTIAFSERWLSIEDYRRLNFTTATRNLINERQKTMILN